VLARASAVDQNRPGDLARLQTRRERIAVAVHAALARPQAHGDCSSRGFEEDRAHPFACDPGGSSISATHADLRCTFDCQLPWTAAPGRPLPGDRETKAGLQWSSALSSEHELRTPSAGRVGMPNGEDCDPAAGPTARGVSLSSGTASR